MSVRRARTGTLYGLGAAAALLAAVCGQVEATTEPASPGRVLLVTGTGGLGDEGFNDAGYEGALRAEAELGIELDVVEPTELAEIEQQYQSAAASGDYLVIVGLGFDKAEPSTLIAPDYPDQLFANIDAASENPNVQGVLFREEENAFLAGVLAAHLTSSDATLANPEKVIGIVLGVDIPHVRRYAVSFEAGARTVDPDIEVLDGVVGNFEDQGIARDLTLAQVAQGADVVYQVAGGAGLGVFSAAEEEQVYAIGEGLNQNALHPDLIVASTYKLMGQAVFDAISSAVDGTFEGGNFEYGFADGYLVVDREGSEVPLTTEAEADLAKYEELLIAGDIVAPFSAEDLVEYLDSLE